MLELADDEEASPKQPLAANRWVRIVLVAIGLGWLGIFAIAAWLKPYDSAGAPLLEATHRQLGLPECTFKQIAGVPCASCGMTTSFAHLVRGDVVNSLRANFAGTILALLGMLYIPWSLISMWQGRWLGMKRLEPWALWIVFGWVALMLARWAIVLTFGWLSL